MQGAHVTSGRLCEETIRAFDRLCDVERRGAPGMTGLTPRQRHRRRMLETRAHADEWRVPDPLAETVVELIAAADRIDDPVLAGLWADHLPVAVLACLERRSLQRRIADGDPLVVGP
jgi:protein-tyrosine-phosphatase